MIKAKIADLLEKSDGGIASGEIEILVPENEKFGHYSTNIALKIAKKNGKNPMEIAEKLAKNLSEAEPNLFEKIEAVKPGFVNFYLAESVLAKEISKILKLKEKYGKKENNGKTAIVEYSSPNIAKPMGVGHLRSTIIGDAIANLLKFQGYKTVRLNHPGDWGTQFGALIFAYKTWGKKEELETNPIDYLVGLYVWFHKEAEENPDLMDKAREETKKLQEGNLENRKFWKLFTEHSQGEFDKIYNRLGIKFDETLGESFYQSKLESAVEEAVKKGIAKEDEGAIKIFFENENLPPLVIKKTDGSFLYSTTDLAAVKYRTEKWNPAKILYVVGNEQSLYFQQLFEAVKMLGYAPKSALEHVKFGMMLGEEGKKMSTRKGEFTKLEELLDKAVEKASAINKDSAEAVGVSSIKYFDLSHFRQSDIVFNWEQLTALKGNSAPYLLYAYARMKSVLRKSGCRFFRPKPDFSKLENSSEKSLVRHLIYFPDAVERAAEFYQPNILTDYLFKLSELANNFYENSPILKSEKQIRNARLALAQAASIVLKTGLNLLGIKTLEKM
jgi:arginyl-tRNA synthetase